VASTLPESIAGSRLAPTLVSFTLDAGTFARARIVFRYADWYGMPAVPTRLPRSSRTDLTPDFEAAIKEVNGR
jgi:hypothetical protein